MLWPEQPLCHRRCLAAAAAAGAPVAAVVAAAASVVAAAAASAGRALPSPAATRRGAPILRRTPSRGRSTLGKGGKGQERQQSKPARCREALTDDTSPWVSRTAEQQERLASDDAAALPPPTRTVPVRRGPRNLQVFYLTVVHCHQAVAALIGGLPGRHAPHAAGVRCAGAAPAGPASSRESSDCF